MFSLLVDAKLLADGTVDVRGEPDVAEAAAEAGQPPFRTPPAAHTLEVLRGNGNNLAALALQVVLQVVQLVELERRHVAIAGIKHNDNHLSLVVGQGEGGAGLVVGEGGQAEVNTRLPGQHDEASDVS